MNYVGATVHHHITRLRCCMQAYAAEGASARLFPQGQVSFPATDLWRHLGCTPSLPWNLDLRVEVDGVLKEQRHGVVMWRGGNASTYVACAAAFRPLVGKQLVAWRFMLPTTLVCAVKEAGCCRAAPAAAATSLSASAGEEEEGEGEEEEEEEEEAEEGGCGRGTRPPPPCPRERGAHASGSIQTIRVSPS